MVKKSFLSIGLLITGQIASAQDLLKTMSHLFTTPKSYIVTYTTNAPKIDGDINDAPWQQAAWTDSFVDIEGDLNPKPAFSTQVKMLWDSSNLYVAVKMQEPHLWANLTRHDQTIYKDNDFELFIDPNNDARDYFEVEVNQRNAIFDLFMPKPYRDKGDALISWDTPGMQTAVQLQGTLNNPTDTDTGWTVEFKIPFSAINIGFDGGVPTDGKVWRINFSRVEWDTQIKNGKYVKLTDSKGKNLPERNWVWSPQGIVNMHAPERWGYLQFVSGKDAPKQDFNIPYIDLQKEYLWLVYYKQKEYYKQHKAFAASLSDLNILSTSIVVNGTSNTLIMAGSATFFSAGITDGKAAMWTINNDGLLQAYK
ncbi:hypothetical protein FFF34_013125 [Inquilinus sp. KBS0705]|nr:hypothetical protein FFF34_013125 [Inquilinus sp. KBS0705]